MKRRLKALLLAAGLTVCAVSPFAAESATEPATEAAVAAADAAGTAEAADTGYAQYYDQMKTSVASLLEELSAMTDGQLQDIIDSGDETYAHVAANWMNVKEELGVFTGVNEQTIEENGNEVTVVTDAAYDSVPDKTKVTVTMTYDMKKGTVGVPEWEIGYPKSKLVAEAGLNTLLGLGTVFIVLVFLSFVIANIHWIPDLVDKAKKKNAPPVQETKAVPAPAAPAPVVEEEDLTDDTELVAVIAAAIAASEQVPVDGFVVRSIRKAKRNKWLGA